MRLRPYQEEIINEVRLLMRLGKKRIQIQAPCGSGKTLLTAYMFKTAAQKNKSCWFICHRRELIIQAMETFHKIQLPFGIIGAGFYEDNKQLVQICGIQTLLNRYHRFAPPSLIIHDESHHVMAKSWEKLFNLYPDAYHIGLSATPERLDGKGLGKYFQELVLGPKVEWLIDNSFLSKYKMFAPGNINLTGVHTRMGDYVKSEITAIVDKPTITGDAIKEYKKRAPGKRAIVFCISIEHSRHVVEQFNNAGINSEHVDGETDANTRDAAIKRFKDGKTMVLSNVDLFGEGFDVPNAECGILLRPTQSLGLYIQQSMRTLRPYPGKTEAIILDHAGNCSRHGLPCADREWSLDGRAGRVGNSEDSAVKIKICPKCFAAQKPGQSQCEYCGMGFDAKPREVEQVAGDLVEINKQEAKMQSKREQGRAESIDDLINIGLKRGYKPHNAKKWAEYITKARQAKKLQRGRQS